MSTIAATNFNFPGQQSVYKGKVREVYRLQNHQMAMVATDRLSAFDVILPQAIPFKGQILNQLSCYMLEATKSVVPNWLIAQPDPNVSIGHTCETFPVEMVIRGYLAGHAYREYASGKREICGVRLPEGLKENDRLPQPIITPTTKAAVGDHDEDISKEAILANGIVDANDYEILEQYTYQLFDLGTQMAKERGLILVDTKYEFGRTVSGEIVIIDEIHTPDSSRYFYADTYDDLQEKGEKQRQLSKEFVREWLIEQGFQGKEGQDIPVIPDEFIQEITQRYIELYEKITGKTFEKADVTHIHQRIENNVLNYIDAN
ncbi:MAG: phosphoribosylaminoimidazolesuccinocarboxamide synthase [Flavobacteriaceae bacterium]|nr:phosphoribosylaminoimidazolesuccinocarboxamide synthase [Flavobacteriaceae bacterium]